GGGGGGGSDGGGGGGGVSVGGGGGGVSGVVVVLLDALARMSVTRSLRRDWLATGLRAMVSSPCSPLAPRVHNVLARPCESVSARSGVTEPPPSTTVKSTVTPGTGLSCRSTSRTTTSSSRGSNSDPSSSSVVRRSSLVATCRTVTVA